METSPLHLVFLNELSLPRALWLALIGRRVCLIDMPPVVPTLPLLATGRRLLCRFPRVAPALKCEPRLAELRELRVPRHHEDPFRIIEPWLDAYIDHKGLDAALGDDAMPTRQIGCNYVFGYFDPLFYLRWFCHAYDPNQIAVVGADEVLVGMYRALYGSPSVAVPTSGHHITSILNPLLMILAAIMVAAVAIRGVRFRPRPPRNALLGSDFMGDDRDPLVWAAVREAGAEAVVVFRSRRQMAENAGRISPLPSIAPGDGGFSPRQAAAEILRGWAAIWRIKRHSCRLAPGLAHRLSLIPVKRLLFRKLLTLYRFDRFWVRDDYNVEHIIRSQELRRYGALSIGVQHGLPISAALIPQWRYIDCDIYYVFGFGILHHYGDRWPSWMRVKAEGSLGLTPLRLAKLDRPRPNDIIFQTKPERTAEPIIAALNALAEAFPTRKIYLQVKRSFTRTFLARAVLEAAARYPNVIRSDENIYDLFLKCRYLVTDPSTVGAEALQFGLYSFMLDYDGRKSLYFRDFSNFCVSDPIEPVRCIKGIEAGTYLYPDYEALIARNGRIYDAIRADIGLRPGGQSARQRMA